MKKKMAETDVLKAMNDLPEEWIESCYEAAAMEETEENSGTKSKIICFGKIGRNTVKWAVAATAALLLCGGGVAYAAKLGIIQIEKYDEKTNPGYSGYSLKVEPVRIATEELTGDIKEAEEFLRENITEGENNLKYSTWSKLFQTVEEAGDYIGYAGMKETKLPGTVYGVRVNAYGDEEGKLGVISMEVGASEGQIYMDEISQVFTENSQATAHVTSIQYEDAKAKQESEKLEFRNEKYITESGKTAEIVYVDKRYGGGFIVGTVVDGAMYYELHISYSKEDSERAKEIMLQWCEQF